jgi:uncharacterized repeat protein (TIGR01451 family)
MDDAIFTGCTFVADKTNYAGTATEYSVFPEVTWTAGVDSTDGHLQIVDCEMQVDASCDASDTIYGVWVKPDLTANNNTTEVHGCTLPTTCDEGVYFEGGGSLIAQDNSIHSYDGIHWKGSTAGRYTTYTAGGNTFDGTGYAEHLEANNAANSVTHTSENIANAKNKIESYYSAITSNVFSGYRTIAGTGEPTTATNGFVGDVFVYDSRQWVCTVAGFDKTAGGTQEATWVETTATPPTVSLSVSPSAAASGDTVTYTATYTNAGAGAITDVTVSVVVPTGVTYVSGGDTYNASTKTVTWALGTVAAGTGATTLTFTATVD